MFSWKINFFLIIYKMETYFFLKHYRKTCSWKNHSWIALNFWAETQDVDSSCIWVLFLLSKLKKNTKNKKTGLEVTQTTPVFQKTNQSLQRLKGHPICWNNFFKNIRKSVNKSMQKLIYEQINVRKLIRHIFRIKPLWVSLFLRDLNKRLFLLNP